MNQIFSVALRTGPLALIYLLGNLGYKMEVAVNIALAINMAQISTLITDFGITGRILNGVREQKATISDVILRIILALTISCVLNAKYELPNLYLTIVPPILLITITRDYFIINRQIKYTLNEGLFYFGLLLVYVIAEDINIFYTLLILIVVVHMFFLIMQLMTKEIVLNKLLKIARPKSDDYFISINRIFGGLTTVLDVGLLSFFVIEKSDISLYLSCKIIVSIFSALSAYFILKFDMTVKWRYFSKKMTFIFRCYLAITLLLLMIISFSDDFSSSVKLILLMCFSMSGICVFSYSILHPFIMKNEGNYDLFILSITSNLIALVCYLTLIPVFGVVGAGFGYVVQNIIAQHWTYLIANKIFNNHLSLNI